MLGVFFMEMRREGAARARGMRAAAGGVQKPRVVSEGVLRWALSGGSGVRGCVPLSVWPAPVGTAVRFLPLSFG